MRAVAGCVAIAIACATAHADPMTRRGGGLSFDPATTYNVPRGASPAEGPANAPITIVEWSDYACGFCNYAQPTLDKLRRLYPGQVRIVHRALPLDDDNVVAFEGALAAAAQGRFRPMHDRLFAAQGKVDRATIELIARELGLDMVRFRADLDSGTYRDAIAADINDARTLGVSGTPAFFMNGRPVHGSQPLRVFAAMVEEELVHARELRAAQPGITDLYAAMVAGGKPTADAPPETTNQVSELVTTKLYRVGVGLPGHQIGPDDAPVTIVEWSDFQCPYCQHEAPVLAQARLKYGDKIRVIYRHFPVMGHRNAELAAEAGVAAAMQGKFWEFHDQVFLNFGHLTRADLETYARTIGLDLDAFKAALDDRRYRDVVMAEAASAEALGVTGTPTLFINGQAVPGAIDPDRMAKAIDTHLALVDRMVAQGLAVGDVYAVLMSGALGIERADPASVPESKATSISLRADDRGHAAIAACRRRDARRARQLAVGLTGDVKQRTTDACAGEGVDL